MKRKILPQIILLLLLLGGIIGIIMFFAFNQSKIDRYETFYCLGWNDFTFRYPIFKGWQRPETKPENSNNCTIELTYFIPGSDLGAITELKILKAPAIESSKPQLSRKNQHISPANIPYELTRDETETILSFFGEDWFVHIRLPKVESGTELNEMGSTEKVFWDEELFWKEIIKTFQFTSLELN
jgi:hypothetical protein